MNNKDNIEQTLLTSLSASELRLVLKRGGLLAGKLIISHCCVSLCIGCITGCVTLPTNCSSGSSAIRAINACIGSVLVVLVGSPSTSFKADESDSSFCCKTMYSFFTITFWMTSSSTGFGPSFSGGGTGGGGVVGGDGIGSS